MGISYFNFRVPQGMALHAYADGSYNIGYDTNKIVELRDWAATLTNSLTDQAIIHIETQKKAEARKIEERANRIANTAFPAQTIEKLEKEVKRIDTHIPLMGDKAPIVTPSFNEKAPKSIKPPAASKSPPKVVLPLPELPPRSVNTAEHGTIVVAGDVTDEELEKLGYTIVKVGEKPTDSNETKPAVSEPIVSETTDAVRSSLSDD